MPARVITVVLNSNHNKRFALRLTSEVSPSDRDTILREAKNKFKIRPADVFLLGGVSLAPAEAVPELASKVWIGKGEPYCGPPAPCSPNDNPAAMRVFCTKSYVDPAAVKQLQEVGRSPGIRLTVGLPDLHPGSRFPIGCVIAAEGIYPALIGSDVGCGIALYELSSRTKWTSNPEKLASALHGLEQPWPGSVSAWLSNYGIERASEFDEPCLGTVGAGDHFAELCTVERFVDEIACHALGLAEGGLYLLVHTGSRGLGGSILAAETADGNHNPYLAPESQHLAEYLDSHDYAVRWAVANRDLVAHRINECLWPPGEEPSPKLGLRKIIDVTHNSVSKHVVTVDEAACELWVHRKGAAPADQGVVPCPGSRGHLSWSLQPMGDGQANAHSLAHGAGRRFGRNVLHTGGQKVNKASLIHTQLSSVVICEDTDLLIEEQPDAYKDVQCVVDDMESAGLCCGVAVLRPVVTYKMRKQR